MTRCRACCKSSGSRRTGSTQSGSQCPARPQWRPSLLRSVRLKRRLGRRRAFEMEQDGETVLEAAERAGFDLPFSCRAGVCSTCRTKVVKGAVEMAQNYALEPWEVEAGFVLACQSRPTTPQLE